MSTYSESTSVPQDPMPTLGFYQGMLGDDVVRNRVQKVRPDANLLQQLTDYYADKMKRIARGEAIQTHPFRTHATALANYEAFLRERIPVQMEMVERTKKDDMVKIIMIPKLYKVKGGMTKADAEKVADLGNEGTALEQWVDGLGYVLNTSAFYSPKKDLVMYAAILCPKRV